MDVLVSFLGIVVMLAIAAGVIFLGVFAVMFFSALSKATPASPAANKTLDDQMDEGDFHSGPEGYSPNTAYPDTFYGSRGSNDEDDWGGHDEGDFNR